MTTEEKLQKLLQIKALEQPEEGFHEEFLAEFQRRQRRELMSRSLWSQAGEQISDFFALLTRPRVLLPAAACYLGIMLLMLLWPHRQHYRQGSAVGVIVAANPGGQTEQPHQLLPQHLPVKPEAVLTSLPKAPQNAPIQRVNSATLPADPHGRDARTFTPQAIRELVGEPLPEQPAPAPAAAPTGKLREL